MSNTKDRATGATASQYLWSWWSLLLIGLFLVFGCCCIMYVFSAIMYVFSAPETEFKLDFAEVLSKFGLKFESCIDIFGVAFTFFAIIFATDRITEIKALFPTDDDLASYIYKNLVLVKDSDSCIAFEKKKNSQKLVDSSLNTGSINLHHAAFYFSIGAIFIGYLGLIESWESGRYGEVTVLFGVTVLASCFPVFIEKLYYGIVSRTGRANQIIDACKIVWANKRIKEVALEQISQDSSSNKLKQNWGYFLACLNRENTRFERWDPRVLYLSYLAVVVVLFFVFINEQENDLLILQSAALYVVNLIVVVIFAVKIDSSWLLRKQKKALNNALSKPYSLRLISVICGILLVITSLLMFIFALYLKFSGENANIFCLLMLNLVSCLCGIFFIVAGYCKKVYVVLYGSLIAQPFYSAEKSAQNVLAEFFQEKEEGEAKSSSSKPASC